MPLRHWRTICFFGFRATMALAAAGAKTSSGQCDERNSDMAQDAKEPKPLPADRPAPGEEREATAAVADSRAALSLSILAGLVILATLYIARDVIIPVVLALLLALLLRPLQRRMRRWRIPDYASALALIAAVVALFALGVLTLAGQSQQWLGEAPGMVKKVSRMLPARPSPMEDLAKTTDAVADLTRSDGENPPLAVEVQSSDVAYTILGVSSQFVAASIIVFVVGYFLLALGDTLMRQAVEAQPSFMGKRNVVQTVQQVEQGISRYLMTITVINIGLGVVTGAAMWLLGVPNPVLWGVMATTLNYVPHVGAFVCMVVLFVVGAVAHESIGYGVLVAGTFVVLTSVESYFLTPLVLSKSLQLSPLAVILAILFWGWMWGIPGGLMAAPLLTVIKIVCDQFQSLYWLAALLSGESASASAANVPGAAAQQAA